MCSLPGDEYKKQRSIGNKDVKGALGELVQEGLSIIRKRLYEEAMEVRAARGVKKDYDEVGSNGASNECPSKRIRRDVTVENKEETTLMCSSPGTTPNRCESLRIFSQDVLPVGIDTGVAGSWVSVTMSKLLRSVGEPEDPIEAFVTANALLDYAWQKLNTGHWRDVPLTWRLVFTWGSVVVAHLLLGELQSSLNGKGGAHEDPLSFAAEVVKACDRGLLMGAPVLANPLHTVASLFNFHARLSTQPSSVDLSCEDIPVTQQDQATVHRPLPTEECPPLDRFLLNYMGKGVPVKLLSIVDHWPALKTWTVPHLREIAGARTVPVEIGARYTDASWSQSLLSLDDYLTRFVSQPAAGAPTGYLAQHQLLDQIPELRDDILVPDYCHLGEEEPRLHAWLGPRGTVSPLHHDPDHNILVQVLGYKYIRLYPEDQSHMLYAHPDPLLSNTSQADVEGSVSEWPLLHEAQYSDLILSPGEALYIPPRHWHYVRSLSTSFSVSFWWR